MCCLVSFEIAFRVLASIKYLFPTRGIRVLGVPLGSLSFIFLFQDALNDDVQHIDALPRSGDV